MVQILNLLEVQENLEDLNKIIHIVLTGYQKEDQLLPVTLESQP